MRKHSLLGAAATALVAAACLAPAASAAEHPAAVLAVNAGGGGLTDSGITYSADRYAKGGKVTTTRLPAGPYRTIRYGMSSYDLPVANGQYDVTLQFVEDYWWAAGKRVFDVSAEGRPALTAFDPFAAAGGRNRPVARTVPVRVADGTLSLGFSAKRDNVTLAGVVVRPSAPSAAPTRLVGRVDGRRAALTWGAVAGATSYAVYETGTPGRPVTTVTSPSRTSGDLADGTYRYSVSARFADGRESLRSSEVELRVGTASTPAPAPTPTSAPAPTTPVPTPTPTTPPASTVHRAAWTAPALVDPVVWTPSAAKRTFSAPANRDVLIQWPSTALDVQGGFELTGGRNVVSRGGTINFSKRYFPAMVDQPNNNRCLKISGHLTATAPRTVHVEGLHCAGQHVWEGINIDSKAERGSLTVQLRDIKMDGVHVEYPGVTGKHIGGDALQAWNGPHRLRVDGFTAKNLEYQGFFLQPYQFGSGKLGAWDIRNVNLEGATQRSAYLLWLAGSRGTAAADGVDLTVKDVWVKPGGGRTRAQTLWDAANDWAEVRVGTPVCDFVR